MVIALIWIFLRPFVRRGMQARRTLVQDQKRIKNLNRAAARRARRIVKPTFTKEERAYMASHVPSDYR